MKYSTDIDFFLSLHPYGWSTCCFQIKADRYEVDMSHAFGAPLEDFIQALIRLLKGQKEGRCYWYGEPGGYQIDFYVSRNSLQITLQEFQASFGEEIKVLDLLVSFDISLKAFLLLAYFQLKKIEQLLNIPSFASHRNGVFPFQTFRIFEVAAKAYLKLN